MNTNNDGNALDEREEVVITPLFRLLRIDEREYWDGNNIQERTLHIYSVYAYDENRHVHICSFTPTYEIRYLYTDIEFIDELYDDAREEERGNLCDLIQNEARTVEKPWDYIGLDTADKRSDEDHPVVTWLNWDELLSEAEGNREAAYMSAMDAIMESESANPTFC